MNDTIAGSEAQDEKHEKIKSPSELCRGHTEPVTSGRILAGPATGEKATSTATQADLCASRGNFGRRVPRVAGPGHQSRGPQYFT